MTDKQANPPIRRYETFDSVTTEQQELAKLDAGSERSIRKSVSLDSGDTVVVKKSWTMSTGLLKRRCVRRRTSKRSSRQEPEYGHDTETYEKIRERVLQERAVTNAIEALQERWGMITYMYNDCVEFNEKRRDRKLRKLNIQRQFELIMILSVFMLICLQVSVFLILILA